MLLDALRQSALFKRLAHELRGLDLDRAEWFDAQYPEWRGKRIEAIRRHYGVEFFAGKTLLEVGCDFGDVGASFVDLGAAVTCTDGRPRHAEEVRRRHPNVTAAVADLDDPWAFERFDVLIHMGVLYHLADPELAMRDALAGADHVVLETEVIDSSDPHLADLRAEAGHDQHVRGWGDRPSAAMLERIITEAGREFTRIDDDRCNDGAHVYDWPVRDTGEYLAGHRRMWFIDPPS